MDDNRLVARILMITVVTLCMVCASTVGVLLVGLFEEGVDNERIFEILAPAFNTVVGAFVGLLGGLSINRGRGDRE